jgi:hypothetical protein
MTELIISFPDFRGAFGDKRIDKRANEALGKLNFGRSSSIRQVTQHDAEQKSFYRLFNNESFSEERITASITGRCSQLCKGRHVLCIQDTTEFNLTSQKGRKIPNSGLGRTSKDDVLGFMMHSSLVVDATKTTALGYSYIKLWHRDPDSPNRHERDYQHLAIEDKESYKWVEAAEKSKEILSEAAQITIVADRESDIYDLLAGDFGERTSLLLRSNFDRRLTGGKKLQEHLNSRAVMHEYELELTGDIRKNMPKRKAYMELKWDKVELVKPKTCKNKSLPSSVAVYVVEAREKKKGGILWRLYTTDEVTTATAALQIVSWYKQRWYIEQVHRLLKSDGFRIERSQLERGWAIRKLTLLAMMASIKIIQMMLAYEDDTEQQLMQEVFTGQEQQCLQTISATMEGHTDKVRNTSGAETLRWATWVIARLGGWKGYKSQRKPGPIVLQKGLAKFYIIFEGWNLYRNKDKLVSTQ